MKLYELLSVLSFDASIAIHNVDDKTDKRPQFQKLRNVNMKKVRNILNYDIMQISQSEKGLWVQVFDRDSLHRELQAWNIADKWFLRQDQRNGRR
ncbi:MAG: hypothetical protein IJ703_01295 [Eubacterium sp.]|nr:hypothetical protein [Eubacterium sp.]